jgi:hypothetical protein
MRITLDIPAEHTAEILATLANLMKPAPVEAQPDPAEGHPELPLAMTVEEMANKIIAENDDESEAIAETRWALVPGIDAADPLKVEAL